MLSRVQEENFFITLRPGYLLRMIKDKMKAHQLSTRESQNVGFVMSKLKYISWSDWVDTQADQI